MVKILMLTGDAGEAQEIYYAKFRLEEEGWQVHIATTAKRDVSLGRARLSSQDSTPTPRSPDIALQADLGLDDVAAGEYRRDWCCPAAALPNICGTDRRRSPSFVIS